jgi:hypothetical protein
MLTLQNAAIAMLVVIVLGYIIKSKHSCVLLLLCFLLGGSWLFLRGGIAGAPTLGGDTLVATVKATEIDNMNHVMSIEIDYPDKTKADYVLSGDRWGLYSEVTNYYSWAAWLGIHNSVHLTRLVPQYDDNQAHEIQPIDLQQPGQSFSIPFIVMNHYQGGVMEPVDGISYRIFVTSRGQMYAKHA